MQELKITGLDQIFFFFFWQNFFATELLQVTPPVLVRSIDFYGLPFDFAKFRTT
jgi:hypothetical protein